MSAGGPRFQPAEGAPTETRVGRLETWASRHDEWSHHKAREVAGELADQGKRLAVMEGKMTKVYASIGEHRLKWGIVAWVLGVAAAAAIAWVAR